MKFNSNPVITIILVLLICQSAGATVATVTIPEESFVSGDKIFLGDIAEITGSSEIVSSLQAIEIRKAPAPGYSVNISRTSLELVLKQKGFAPETLTLDVPQNFKVTGNCQTVNSSDLAEIAISFVKETMPWHEDSVNITLQSLSSNEITLPEGNIEFLPSAPYNMKFIGNVSIPVEIIINGVSVKKVNVSLKIQVFSEVLVATTGISRGDILSPENISLEKREIKNSGDNIFTDPAQIEGRVASVNISRGTVITEKLTESPLMVRNGDLVTIIAVAGQVEVRAMGKSKQNGRFGDIIDVVNTDSGKRLKATVIETGTVLIEVK